MSEKEFMQFQFLRKLIPVMITVIGNYNYKNEFKFICKKTFAFSLSVGSGGNGKTISSNNPDLYTDKYDLLQNFPNPFDEATTLTVVVKQKTTGTKGVIRIATMNGSIIKEIPIVLNYGNNQVVFSHNYAYTGTLIYSLYVDGQQIASKRMIIAN